MNSKLLFGGLLMVVLVVGGLFFSGEFSGHSMRVPFGVVLAFSHNPAYLTHPLLTQQNVFKDYPLEKDCDKEGFYCGGEMYIYTVPFDYPGTVSCQIVEVSDGRVTDRFNVSLQYLAGKGGREFKSIERRKFGYPMGAVPKKVLYEYTCYDKKSHFENSGKVILYPLLR